MKDNQFDVTKPMQVGGQAVIEGVMMRAPGMVATAVRRKNGEIVVKTQQYKSLAEKNSFCKLPVLRGAVGLIEMLFIGIGSLNFSTEVAMKDEQEAAGKAPETKKEKSNLALGLMVAFSLAVGIAMFFVTPIFLTTLLFDVSQHAFLFNVISGVIRISLLLGYMIVISQFRDISRLFAYHGAEHKAVFAFEFGELLAVSSAAKQSRFHPRCGTSFLLIVMFVAILMFSVLDTFLIGQLGELTIVTRLLTHLPLIPIVGGVSYEFIKASARISDTMFGRMIVAPGLWLQRITTREPDESQLEVAIVALQHALGTVPSAQVRPAQVSPVSIAS